MSRIAILLLSILPTLLFAQAGSPSSSKSKAKTGHSFYIKTEVLNTLLRVAFVRPTYDIDIQGTVRLTNPLHLVGTYGKTTFDMTDSVESALRARVYQFTDRKGVAFHRSSLMLRYYPFNEYGNVVDYLFVEGGFHFQHYKGTTSTTIYDSTVMAVESQFHHALDMYRYGPQINIGLSRYFDNTIDAGGAKRKVLFSPEVFIGVMYHQLYRRKDEITEIIGTVDAGPYTEPKVRLTLRAKIGIGIL